MLLGFGVLVIFSVYVAFLMWSDGEFDNKNEIDF
jgi:hypothetical protein